MTSSGHPAVYNNNNNKMMSMMISGEQSMQHNYFETQQMKIFKKQAFVTDNIFSKDINWYLKNWVLIGQNNLPTSENASLF